MRRAATAARERWSIKHRRPRVQARLRSDWQRERARRGICSPCPVAIQCTHKRRSHWHLHSTDRFALVIRWYKQDFTLLMRGDTACPVGVEAAPCLFTKVETRLDSGAATVFDRSTIAPPGTSTDAVARPPSPSQRNRGRTGCHRGIRLQLPHMPTRRPGTASPCHPGHRNLDLLRNRLLLRNRHQRRRTHPDLWLSHH